MRALLAWLAVVAASGACTPGSIGEALTGGPGRADASVIAPPGQDARPGEDATTIDPGTDGGTVTPLDDAGTVVTPPTWEKPRFTCSAGEVPAELPLRRLTRTQYLNSVRDVVASTGLSAGQQALVLDEASEALERFPRDRVVGLPGETHGGFERLDQAVQQSHIDVAYDVATDVARQLVLDATRTTIVVGACATDANTGNDRACFDTFVNRFGALVMRRPVPADELTALRTVAGANLVARDALADVIALLLQSPFFLYHVEDGDPAAPGPVDVDAHALAARLSYHFWQTMPDAPLRALAASGELLRPEVLATEVDRLFADPRADAVVRGFFREWLRLDELPPLNTRIGDPVFDDFAGADAPSAQLHTEMKDEVLDLVTHTARSGGTIRDLVTSNQSFARTPALARVYGDPPWDGTSTPGTMSQTARAGLITRAAFLASGSANTRPVMKGYRLRTALLCKPIPPPPDNAMAQPLDLSPDSTTREVVEALTEQPNTACAGCHRTLLNPLGFVTENFDALGRLRSEQTLYAPDGTRAGTKPVNTRAAPNINDVTTEVAGARDVSALLRDGGEVDACFARQYFRFTFQRPEDLTRDGCALAALQDAALDDAASIADLWKAIALRPEFARRDFR